MRKLFCNLVLLAMGISIAIVFLLNLCYRRYRSRLSEQHDHQGNDQLPAAHLGLSMDDIAALPTFPYEARAATPAVECDVCLEELEYGDVVRMLPACMHFFHGSCIEPWLRENASCPVCRRYPEPELVRRGEAALSPPLPPLRRFEVLPERPTATTIYVMSHVEVKRRSVAESTSCCPSAKRLPLKLW